MRHWRLEIPVALALLVSVALHIAALVGPAWSLPGFEEPEPLPPLEAVLSRPAEAPAVVAVSKPVPPPQPPPKAPRPKPDPSPRSAPVAAAPVADAVAPAPTFPDTAATPAAPVPVAAAPVETIPPPPLPAAIALPSSGRVRYAITRGEGGFVVGQAVHTWEHDGFTYVVRSLTETTGLAAIFKPAKVMQESRGSVSASGLVPREFRHERVNGVDTASFDWARQVVSYAGREETIAAGTQDMLSMYYQAVLLLPQQATGSSLELAIATGRKLDRYRFDVVAEETLTTKLGERRTTRLSAKSGNDTIELWIAADVRGLPLKIRFIDRKGEIFDQLAEELSIGKLGEKP